jgi:hypothetical protein
MGLREFWDRLTGGDKEELVEEEMRDHGGEHPEQVEDYEALKDDRQVDQRYPAGESLSSDEF